MGKPLVDDTHVVSGMNITILVVPALVGYAASLAGCLADQMSNKTSITGTKHREPAIIAPAAPVPKHVVTESLAGIPIFAEQGDLIEVRLEEPTQGSWMLTKQSGDASLVLTGTSRFALPESKRIKRLFIFRAASVGKAELTFGFHGPSNAAIPQPILTFTIEVR